MQWMRKDISKFYDVVEPIIQQKVEIPEAIRGIMTKKKESILMTPSYNMLKEYLLS